MIYCCCNVCSFFKEKNTACLLIWDTFQGWDLIKKFILYIKTPMNVYLIIFETYIWENKKEKKRSTKY